MSGGAPTRTPFTPAPGAAPSKPPIFSRSSVDGVRIVVPPTFALLTGDAAGNIRPWACALNAKRAGLDIITWTLERSGILADGGSAVMREGDVYRALDVLAREVGVIGVFSDWPARALFKRNFRAPGLRRA